MINKVNAPPQLALVKESKETQHDPGASSGSGLAYERHPEAEQQDEKEERPKKKAKLAVVSELEKSGMTDVVKDFYENRSSETPAASPGLSIRYQTDSSRTKGLLLNKKAE